MIKGKISYNPYAKDEVNKVVKILNMVKHERGCKYKIVRRMINGEERNIMYINHTTSE